MARDIGDKIGCGGHLKKLRRTKSYSFTENHSVLLPENSESYLENKKPKILNPKDFLNHLPSFQLRSEEETIGWRSGRKINVLNYIELLSLLKKDENYNENIENILVLDQNGLIAGIGEIYNNLAIKPKVVFNAIG